MISVMSPCCSWGENWRMSATIFWRRDWLGRARWRKDLYVLSLVDHFAVEDGDVDFGLLDGVGCDGERCRRRGPPSPRACPVRSIP